MQQSQPDQFFSSQQRDRLSELMSRWRAARDSDRELAPDEQAELDALVQAEMEASARRAAVLH